MPEDVTSGGHAPVSAGPESGGERRVGVGSALSPAVCHRCIDLADVEHLGVRGGQKPRLYCGAAEAGGSGRRPEIPAVETDVLGNNVEEVERVPYLGELIVGEKTRLDEVPCDVVDLVVTALAEAEDLEGAGGVPGVGGGAVDDPVGAIEGRLGVPAGETV